MSDEPWSAVAGGVTLHVRLTPKGGRDAIDGIEMMSDGRTVLKARVRAAPSEGEANDALLKLIARSVSVPNRDVTLAAGATGRVKRLVLSGDSLVLIGRLQKLFNTQ